MYCQVSAKKLANALRDAIDVLEETKKSFKSKRLELLKKAHRCTCKKGVKIMNSITTGIFASLV